MIRPGSASDLDALDHLEETCFAERRFKRDHLSWVLHNGSAFTLLEVDRGLRGAVMVLLETDVARVLSVAVAPPLRRRGIGRRLMEAAETFAANRGARVIRLEVGVTNQAAIALYRSMGYRADGLLPRYYSWGEDAHSMWKPVAGLTPVPSGRRAPTSLR
jgi:ribosomal protein S18 acetylase RimI-like enzyme